MTASTATRTPGHACDDTCGWATGSPNGCTCACRGRNHGSYLVPAGSVPTRMADPFAGIPATSDEAF